MDDKLNPQEPGRRCRAAIRAGGRRMANPQVEPVHLLLALLKQADGTAQPLLEGGKAADVDRMLAEATAVLRKLPQTARAPPPAPP